MHPPTAQDLHTLLAEFAGSSATTVALGLISLHPTAHRAHLSNGTTVHTWCALDTLLIARLLQCDVEVHSRSPHPAPGELLHLAITSERLQADPQWILSFPHASDEAGRHFTQAFCPYANLFASLADYEQWAPRQSRPTTPITVTEADIIAREYAAAILKQDRKIATIPGRCSATRPTRPQRRHRRPIMPSW